MRFSRTSNPAASSPRNLLASHTSAHQVTTTCYRRTRDEETLSVEYIRNGRELSYPSPSDLDRSPCLGLFSLSSSAVALLGTLLYAAKMLTFLFAPIFACIGPLSVILSSDHIKARFTSTTRSCSFTPSHPLSYRFCIAWRQAHILFATSIPAKDLNGGTDLREAYEYHCRPPPPALAPGIALASDDQCMTHWESYKMPRYCSQYALGTGHWVSRHQHSATTENSL